ncbi:hypothetical protein BH11MYX1_BH11MYX1_20320 [soil metagenome]
MNEAELRLAVAILAAMISLWFAVKLRAWRGSWRARRRAARARAGEDRAGEMLVAAGFSILERQARVAWAPLIDGAPCELELRVDYLVERDGELLVAEVKTGEAAPSIETAATRRQLLEYFIAFAADGILLVCPERDQILRVEFPQLKLASGPYT